MPTVMLLTLALARPGAAQQDGDWADVSAPRCSDAVPGVDELGLIYFESRWRFIYTDLFQAPEPEATAKR